MASTSNLTYSIRSARPDDLALLPDIELSAAELFLTSPEFEALYQDELISLDDHQTYLQAWNDLGIGEGGTFVVVAHDSDSRANHVAECLVGFVLTTLKPVIHGPPPTTTAAAGADAAVTAATSGVDLYFAHICEIGVHKDHQRRGLAGRLLNAVRENLEGIRRTSRQGHVDVIGISLTTLRDVPFNGPFYARLGFAEIVDVDGIRRVLGTEGVKTWLEDSKRLASAGDVSLTSQRCLMFCPFS